MSSVWADAFALLVIPARGGRWRPTSRRRFARWIRPTRSSTTSRCAISSWRISAGSTARRVILNALCAAYVTRMLAAAARVRPVHVQRLLDHPLGAEQARDARESCRAHTLAAFRTLQEIDNRGGERAVVAGTHEQPGLTVGHDLRNPARIARHARFGESHGVQQ